MVQWVKPLLATLASHVTALVHLGCCALQLSANAPAKAAEDGQLPGLLPGRSEWNSWLLA